ncbi:potassium/sodium hyperpolarization-activated cyclic nucleotide-gated channel protein [Tasmannia lanceolata]|uniref:potassium/sodium hyperpolarization-activated cyclic nucleotide-gated channel protein n=1 Tax=Tasmannia lanceolata TaxID=3420 RepID=UPI004063637A
MASTSLQFPLHLKPHLHPNHKLSTHKNPIIKCTSNPNSNPNPEPNRFELEKLRKSEILKKSQTSLEKPQPQNFEIGWKRTKEIKLEKSKGFVIADFLEKLEGLMGREYGSKELLAKVGSIVAERVREEAEVLRDGGEVEERLITELFRVLRLMEMDLEMVKASVKEETLRERLEQAIARCRQAILVANSF